MVITNLEEKENRKIWVPIRGGNRGGWSLFNWQNVREMPYKDRQMYLGNSYTIGVLDKGGKWRKRDWYMKTDKKYKSDHLDSEQQEAIRKDYERMNAALGITEKQDEQKLTEQQMRELMKKIKMKKQGYQEPIAPEAIGMGFDKTKVEIRAKPSVKMQNPHKLEAYDDFLTEEKELKEEQQQEKKEKKQKKQKKEKKEKKDKKKKDKQHKHRHRENSQEKGEKKKKKEKHSKRDREDKQERRRDRSRSEQRRKRRRYSSSSSRSSNSN